MSPIAMLFSDIEDSTALVRQLGESWLAVLAQHRRICRSAWTRHRGEELATEGDSFFVTFDDPRDAIAAAITAQEALTSTAWPGGVDVRTRIGVHHGPARRHENGLIGIEVHRAARLCSAAHGDQILASTALIEAGGLPTTVTATDLGPHRLRGLGTRLHLVQLTSPGLPTVFGPPRTHEPEARGAARIVGDAAITVATIDNHEVVRDGVAARLQRDSDLQVIASVATVEDYFAATEDNAQVVLLDLWLDGGDAIDSIPTLRERGSRVLVCTTEQRPEWLRRAVEAGAAGVILKRDPVSAIVTGVRRAAAGEFYCSSSLAHALLTGTDSAAAFDADERDILEGIARGVDDHVIAAGLGLTAEELRRRLVRVRERIHSSRTHNGSG